MPTSDETIPPSQTVIDAPGVVWGAAPMIDSARLLRGTREVLIQHGSEYYRLRHTRNDKLILTK